MPDDKKELIDAAKKLPPTEVFSLKPRNFEEAFRFANLIAESDLIPKEFQKKPANVLVAVQVGMELGVSPMQALQSIYVINGRPAIFGDLLPAVVFQSGLLESIKEEGDDKTASCTVKRVGHEPITRTFTMDDAIRAGLAGPNGRNPTYKIYPKRMLQMRARSLAFRDMFPDVLKGVAAREEAEDTAIEVQASKQEERRQIERPRPLEDGAPKLGADQKPPEPPQEKPLRDTAIEQINAFTPDTFPDPSWMTPYLKELSKDDQLALTVTYNQRKKELGL